MSWMSDISIMIEEAATVGATLTVADFRRLGDRLVIDGIDADEWFELVIHDQEV